MPEERRPIPWRTIFAVIASVVAVGLAVVLLRELARIVAWILVAGFFAVVLSPAVDFCQRRLRMRRGLAVTTVFVTTFVLVAAMLYAFIRPIVDQSIEFGDRFPGYVQDAKEGKGTIGKLVQRYDVDEWVEKNQDRLERAVRGAGRPALDAARTIANTIVALVTIIVLAVLMLLQGPGMLQGGLNALAPERRERVRRVAADAAKAVSGYMTGNLIISLIAGVATYIWLLAWGVPFRGVLGLWVAFADLIPLVGATLGAIPTVGVAFLHSVPAGIGTVIFYIAYQQFENHVLQVTVMSKTVKLNPLLVLISVLVGVELFGILGALLAIPAGGIIQVVVRDLWDERQGRMKEVPTIGADETPIPVAPAEERAEETAADAAADGLPRAAAGS
jgi:predicted PurR-regulated permease PerM